MEEGLRIQWQPDEEQQLEAIEFGKKIVANQK
jgi:hypothetical protein